MKTAYYGLDFGTSNCVISVNINGSVKTLPINFSTDKTDILESVIYFSKTNNISYGSEAIKKYLGDLERSNVAKTETIVGENIVKILQGSEFIKVNESIETTNFDSGRIIRSFKSGLSSTGFYKTNINGKPYDLEDIVTLFLSEIKRRADEIVGLNIETVVIGRPYKFVGDKSNGTVPLKRLESIALRAGFKDIHFEYEPVGAARSYNQTNSGLIFVFDFGGGTLDTSIVDIKNGKVLANFGEPIGGDLMDLALYDEYIAKYFGKGLYYGLNKMEFPRYIVNDLVDWFDTVKLRTDKFQYMLDSMRYMCSDIETLERIRFLVKNNLSYKLRKEIVLSKEALSYSENKDFEFFVDTKKVVERLNKAFFERNIFEYLEKSKEIIDTTLRLASINNDKIDKVILTGGSSQIPAFHTLLEDYFSKDRVELFEPFRAVSRGLAVCLN